jgi:PEGA domain
MTVWLAFVLVQPLIGAPKAKSKPVKNDLGQIEVRGAQASGAKLFIDDKLQGVLPLVAKVTPGEHVVRVKKLGFLPAEGTIGVAGNKTAIFNADLLPFAGVIAVRSSPKGAQVFVDGRGVGVTPYEGELNIGRRSIEVKKDGFLIAREVYQVGAGESYRFEPTLQKGQEPSVEDARDPTRGTANAEQ